MEAQSDFRNIDEELECVENALRVHPDWIRHSWFVRGGDADLWPDTVPRLEKENENIRTRTYTHGHHPAYVFDFDPEVAHDWTLDASTVELISNHAKNMVTSRGSTGTTGGAEKSQRGRRMGRSGAHKSLKYLKKRLASLDCFIYCEKKKHNVPKRERVLGL